MKRMLLLAGVGLLISGCASPNVNPPQARANTGYVDFYAASADELSWKVARFDDRSQSFKSVFDDLKPPQGGVLRLAFPPGHYRLQVTFLNRVVREPGLVEVEVKDGLITPVHIVPVADGTTTVYSKEERWGRARYGRGDKIKYDASAAYRISAEANAPRPYQPKELTSYAP
jgi:hypothetical protein